MFRCKHATKIRIISFVSLIFWTFCICRPYTPPAGLINVDFTNLPIYPFPLALLSFAVFSRAALSVRTRVYLRCIIIIIYLRGIYTSFSFHQRTYLLHAIHPFSNAMAKPFLTHVLPFLRLKCGAGFVHSHLRVVRIVWRWRNFYHFSHPCYIKALRVLVFRQFRYSSCGLCISLSRFGNCNLCVSSSWISKDIRCEYATRQLNSMPNGIMPPLLANYARGHTVDVHREEETALLYTISFCWRGGSVRSKNYSDGAFLTDCIQNVTDSNL